MPESKERRALADSDTETWGAKNHYIVKDEIAAINTRRGAARPLKDPGPDKMIDAVGLALSGGGIRSAAICLGVLQGLNHHGLLPRIDYLSSVSGGGYIGSSLTTTMTLAKEFVFGAPFTGTKKIVTASEISDTPAVGHIRNYANYLIPAGLRDVLTGVAIVVRGLVANLSLTLPVVLFLAAVTLFSTPLRSCLAAPNLFGVGIYAHTPPQCNFRPVWPIEPYGFSAMGALVAVLLLVASALTYLVSRREQGRGPSVALIYLAGLALTVGVICDIARPLQVKNFAVTLAAALAGLALFFAWALKQSFAPPDRLQEFRGHLPTIGATFLVLLATIGFFEFQPFMIDEMFGAAASGTAGGVVTGVAAAWLKSLAAIAAPIAGVVTLFRQQFAEFLKGNSVSSELGSLALAVAAKAAVWVAGVALPLLIWIGYLYLCYWGVGNDTIAQAGRCPALQANCAAMLPAPAPSDGFAGKIQFDTKTRTLAAEITNQSEANSAAPAPATLTSHAPSWLVSLASLAGRPKALTPLFGDKETWEKDSADKYGRSMAALYALVAVVLFAVSWPLKPNANSLHRLYRDRLSKAFLFDPKHYADGAVARNEASLDQGRDFLPVDDAKLSDLYPPSSQQDRVSAPQSVDPRSRKLEAPYHLINAALNIQGSDYANRRGRNADFFLFSPLHLGSEATGYAATDRFESFVPELDLATAVAISGAAASSNMGSSSIRALTPTLALLNVRLGYWLDNPRYLRDWENGQRMRGSMPYLWSEISGRLYENSPAIYLSDGGHIENLGIYELLRRRCRVILAVDAEADASMNFPALVTLQRYARIDLGVRIDLPWQAIHKQTLAWMTDNAGKSAPDKSPAQTDGPHVAIGTIDYGGGETGYLVYIKSSLTGDENDYIRDYARRYDRFPHETTGDQFFSEEQFEVYRALGFHMTHEFLAGRDDVAVRVGDGSGLAKFAEHVTIDEIKKVREALGLPVSEQAAAAPSESPRLC